MATATKKRCSTDEQPNDDDVDMGAVTVRLHFKLKLTDDKVQFTDVAVRNVGTNRYRVNVYNAVDGAVPTKRIIESHYARVLHDGVVVEPD